MSLWSENFHRLDDSIQHRCPMGGRGGGVGKRNGRMKMGVYHLPRQLLDRAAWLAITVVVATLPLEEASQRAPIAQTARRATAKVPPTQAAADREAHVNEMAMVASNMYMKSKEIEREVHTWDWSIPEDGQMPLSRRAEGWPAYDFSVRTIAGDGMLSEMQEALEMVRSGEWGFNECQDRFAKLFDQVLERGVEEANGGLVGLPGVRAWNCMVEAAATECAQGELQGWQSAWHVVQEMERLGCWPNAETFDIWLGGVAAAAWKGLATFRHTDSIIKWMTVTRHTIVPADGIYRQGEAMVGPIALPKVSPPVGVARTAINATTKTMNYVMEVCAASVMHGQAGVPDARRIIYDYGKNEVCPDQRSYELVCQVVKEACRAGRGSVWQAQELLAKMDWGRRCRMDPETEYYAPEDLGEDIIENGAWVSDIRPGAGVLIILLEALSFQVEFDQDAGMEDARRLTRSMKKHCGVEMGPRVCGAFSNVAAALARFGRMTSKGARRVLEEAQEMGGGLPQDAEELQGIRQAISLVLRKECAPPPAPHLPPGGVRMMMQGVRPT